MFDIFSRPKFKESTNQAIPKSQGSTPIMPPELTELKLSVTNDFHKFVITSNYMKFAADNLMSLDGGSQITSESCQKALKRVNKFNIMGLPSDIFVHGHSICQVIEVTADKNNSATVEILNYVNSIHVVDRYINQSKLLHPSSDINTLRPLKHLKLISRNPNIESLEFAFINLKLLETLDISEINPTNIKSTRGMCEGLWNLETLIKWDNTSLKPNKLIDKRSETKGCILFYPNNILTINQYEFIFRNKDKIIPDQEYTISDWEVYPGQTIRDLFEHNKSLLSINFGKVTKEFILNINYLDLKLSTAVHSIYVNIIDVTPDESWQTISYLTGKLERMMYVVDTSSLEVNAIGLEFEFGKRVNIS